MPNYLCLFCLYSVVVWLASRRVGNGVWLFFSRKLANFFQNIGFVELPVFALRCFNTVFQLFVYKYIIVILLRVYSKLCHIPAK